MLSGSTIIFEILPLLGDLYHFLKFSQKTVSHERANSLDRVGAVL
jgi:hypothetical protein